MFKQLSAYKIGKVKELQSPPLPQECAKKIFAEGSSKETDNLIRYIEKLCVREDEIMQDFNSIRKTLKNSNLYGGIVFYYFTLLTVVLAIGAAGL